MGEDVRPWWLSEYKGVFMPSSSYGRLPLSCRPPLGDTAEPRQVSRSYARKAQPDLNLIQPLPVLTSICSAESQVADRGASMLVPSPIPNPFPPLPPWSHWLWAACLHPTHHVRWPRQGPGLPGSAFPRWVGRFPPGDAPTRRKPARLLEDSS